MNWTDLLNKKTVQPHSTSKQEIADLRAVVERDFQDASIKALSPDRRFATAYNAALQLSQIAINCAGYRVKVGGGHHQKTFEAVRMAIVAPEVENLADYFDLCRRKRNDIDYDAAGIVSDTDADELLSKAKEFQNLVEDWIKNNHPQFSQ
jgi:hypothetical protein